jgi:hypothetical protein
MSEVNASYYECLATRKDALYPDTIKAMDVVRKFIIREKKILVGGMAIDYALKIKNPQGGIYDDTILPDYDFYSSKHHKDAYMLAQMLNRIGLKNISVINAIHPSTLKVRVNFVVVADITYVPDNILSNLPTLYYKGFTIVHPHYQMIDQHRSLSFPYEGAPGETIMHRLKKDMKRYDMLYEHYPLRLLNVKNIKITLSNAKEIPKTHFKDQCASGFLALNYWINEAVKLGFQTNKTFGKFKINSDTVSCQVPNDAYITVFSNDLPDLFKKLKGEPQFFSRVMDKLPRRVVIGDWELYENDQGMAAYEVDGMYIANIQCVMLYLLTHYILLMKIKNVPRGFSFYSGYLICRDLILWASCQYDNADPTKKKKLELFFPSHTIYKNHIPSEIQRLMQYKFDVKNKGIKEDIKLMDQPKHVYDQNLKDGRVPNFFYNFKPRKSELFWLDGCPTHDFIA